MKKINQHILSTINFEVNTRNKKLAYGIKDSAGTFFYNEILPSLESLFDELGPPSEVRRFDSIDVDLEVRSLENLSELKGLILSQLKGRLEQSPADYFKLSDTKIIDNWDTEKPTSILDFESSENEGFAGSELLNLENIFIFFLENGLLPWYGNPSHFDRFNTPDYFQKSFKNESFRNRLKSVLKKSELSFYRFVKQCDEKLVVHFIELLLKEKQHEPDTILHRLEILNREQRDDILLFMLACLLESGRSSNEFHYQKLVHGLRINQTQSENEKIQFEFLKQVIDLVKPETFFPEELQNINDTQLFLLEDKVLEIQDKTELFLYEHLPELLNEFSPEPFDKSKKIGSENAIFINTAGLVIAHPFIWSFLVNTGCADKKHIYATEISRAVYLLRFLAVGDENVPEFDLIFEKFLCGIPPQYPLERHFSLSDQDKFECEEMLKSMIANWPALKNSSPDTVRQMFLQRDGKLDITRKPGKLFVERKAQDVLLEKLQWNISVVKLPSMSEVLFVEW